MLVNELKNEIEKYDKNDLKKLIVELYKRIPKSNKENYNIDGFIKNINDKTTKNEANTSFEDLQKEIIYFLDCVDKEYYVIPNKIISKKERSSWRFKVKRYYKELNKILPNSLNGPETTILLIEIFKRLSIGSNRLLFINWETFNALGVSQSEYYDLIVKRILYNGYFQENLEKCLQLLDIAKTPDELSYSMYEVFISNLKTIDTKEMAIDLLNHKVEQLKLELQTEKDWHLQFYIKENINNCTICILEIYLIIREFEIGIKYFQENYIEDMLEIKEYVLLEKLEELDLKKEWLKEYEDKINKVDFRKSLKEKYHNFKNE